MNHVVFWSKFLGHIRVQVLSFFCSCLFFCIFVFRSDFCDGVKMAAQVWKFSILTTVELVSIRWCISQKLETVVTELNSE